MADLAEVVRRLQAERHAASPRLVVDTPELQAARRRDLAEAVSRAGERRAGR